MQMEDSSQLIEANGWSNHWKIRNGDESVSRGTGPWISISFPLGCFQLFRSIQAWFFKNLYILRFSRVFQFWIHTHIFGNNISITLMNGPFVIHWLPLITHDAAQLGTNLFSWHIWGWNHDAAADYAGVQLGVEPKIGVFTPQIIHLFIGYPYFLERPSL